MPILQLIERISQIPKLTGAQRQVARYFETAFRELPFATSESIAQQAGVSKATVVRMVQRLGYESLADLKDEVRQALYNPSDSPAEKAARLKHPRNIPALLEQYREREVRNLESTFQQLDTHNVQGLCEQLIQARRVWVYGQRFSYGLAFNLGLLLAQVLPDVRTVGGEAGTIADAFSSSTPDDHVIIMAHRRIAHEKVILANYLRERHVPYSLITDLTESEHDLVRHAAFTLRSTSNSVSAFNSYTASHTLIQAVALVLETHAPTAIDRLATAEIALHRFQVFDGERR